MNGRVLLTGANGLIGRAAAQALRAAGHHVIAAGRSPPTDEVEAFIECDLLDAAARARALKTARAECLLHLAWHDGPDRMGAPANLDWAAATLELVRGFRRAGGRRAVCAGSCAEYDWSAGRLAEDAPLAPASLYGQVKAVTGTALMDEAPATGLSLVWARIFFVYGPQEPEGRLLGDVLHGLAAGRAVPCTDGKQRRDFLHVDDVGRALVAVLDSGLEGAVNIGSGRAEPVGRLIALAAEAAGHPELIRLGARPRPAGDADLVEAEVRRLASIGFEPRFDLASGVTDCVARFRPSAAAGEGPGRGGEG